ncbi:MAG: threonylcarbamoyl-AMP synthase [Candidatus Kerfeldbacteria bacterium RIFCSPLOWO2_01_FULL_48_11]|uniref:L-threonylcarbamoyladenylate synthase n=1 Tax=Candidatus Kerfeldbacteria bacterium RIFCSPLOWO2_01_FULL_48_11 TaxID=1798543 RepID=A0A1G2B6M4_9BACT|nr:MAG: Sua5/YciO/YrdC/YwlC family protein [Parcubacteria group bacterium GW2011_GWA2_48_9]KKW15864.1 MAG: Sua5/YciO/YrdC/YwlC family protein [Parcubacteria group bacterium GW2011_GWC2_49_9]OGY84802.1 MAG: threonylcarbamoyl-AMP synthase [Candidatus Kerfeldbacteria bacterium RIFCSPLOWO2_01_FULL_48_11]
MDDIVPISQHEIPSAALKRAINTLQQGGVVVYPTDTAYGLAVDALSEEAIGKLFIIKKRVQKPLPVIVASVEMLRTIAVTNPLAEKLMKKYWPGPLTIIFLKKEIVPPALTLGLPTVGVKIPDSKVARDLVRAYGKPLTSTSANLSGTQNNYSLDDVLKQFRDQEARPDLYLDAGILEEIPVSTVVDTTGSKIKVIREGPIHIAA